MRAYAATNQLAAAGTIPKLIAAVGSPASGAQEASAMALMALANHGSCRRARLRRSAGVARSPSRAPAVDNQSAIAAAGGIRPLIALLRSPVAGVAEAAARALRNLSRNGAPPCAASRAVAAVRRCRTLTVARARRRQQVCDCGGRGRSAADCAAPLTCRGSGRSSGEGVVEPERQRCAAVRCVARGCGGPPVSHAHRRARPQTTTSLRLRRPEALRR